ncbi:MAG: M20/M25/M40 family metallo-hydrolase, partial [Actinomycetota bacterium]
YGRGSVDTKATLAVVLQLLERQVGDLTANLVLIGTVAEEAGGLLGAYRLREWSQARDVRFDQMIVAEPTSCVPVHGHKGGVGLEITVIGEAAHSSKPELGRNAIEGAARIIGAFRAEHELLVAQVPATSVGNGTLSVTQIEGGLARNIIPDRCTLYAGRRIAPGEDPEAEFDRLRKVAAEAAAPLPIEVVMTNGRCSPAFYQPADSPLVTELGRLAGAGAATAGYGSNALVYGEIADEIVVFGPGSIDQAHKAVEWIDTSELARACAIYHDLLIGRP